MSMKTILVPMEYHDTMQSALETALLLGRRCDSYIEGFALRWAIDQFLVGDVMAGVVPVNYSEDIAAETKKAKRIFETFMQQHDVPRATETTESMSFGWLDDASEGESFIGSYGRVFDVIVMKRRDEHSGPMHDRAIEIWPVRERSADTIVSTVAAAPDRHQRADCMELQHRAGASHCSCDAASSEGRSHYGPDGHWRNGSGGTLG